MKNKLQIIFTLLLVSSISSYAKGQNGIYLSSADYIHNKLSYEGTTKISTHNFFWSMPTVTVKSDDKKYRLKKSSIYGYRNSKDEVYRFYNNTEYRIAEAGSIYIYVKERNIAMSKGYKVVNTYYFSTSADGTILPLTIGNLRTVYNSNDKFRNAIDRLCDSEDICAFDSERHTFKINYLYSTTITGTN